MADNVNESGEPGLVPVTRRTYMAPGGDYSRLQILHSDNCRYKDGNNKDNIRTILEHAGYTTFKQVEAAIRGI